MELQGRIVKELGISSGTNQQGNPWKKVEYVFGFYENPSDIYERNIVLSYLNDHADQNANFHVGDQVKVRVALTCREYPKDSGKYFNDIRCGDLVMIKPANGANQPQQGASAQPAGNQPTPQQNAPQNAPNQQNAGGQGDDLPF